MRLWYFSRFFENSLYFGVKNFVVLVGYGLVGFWSCFVVDVSLCCFFILFLIYVIIVLCVIFVFYKYGVKEKKGYLVNIGIWMKIWKNICFYCILEKILYCFFKIVRFLIIIIKIIVFFNGFYLKYLFGNKGCGLFGKVYNFVF